MARIDGAAFLLGLALLIGAFATGQSAAQESAGSPQADPCVAASAGKEMWDSDAAMWTCRQEQLARSEADLAAIVSKLDANYGDDPPRAQALKAANDAWLSFRDAECKLLNIDSESGTMYDLYLTACLTEKNVERITQMHWLAENP